MDFIRDFIQKIKCFSTLRLFWVKSFIIALQAVFSNEEPEDSPFLRIGWKLDHGIVELPDWFEENRVQAHTRLPIHHTQRGFGSPAFTKAALHMKELGAGAYTRHVKTCSQSPWWPTAAPVGPDGEPLWNGVIGHCETGASLFSVPDGINVVQEMVNEAGSEGVHLMTYYWHMSELLLSSLHSDWICKEPDCITNLTDPRDAPWLDITVNGYRDIVLQRLLELAEMGVEGFYFDFRHLPLDGCWCTAVVESFESITNTPAPMLRDWDDPQYRKFLDFKAYKIEETFAYWKEQVKTRFPEIVFVISATGIPAPHSRIETTNLVRLSDSTKNEYKHALDLPLIRTFFDDHGLAVPDSDIRQGFGWALLRDPAGGRPPHIWERAFPNSEHTLAAVAALVTYGAVANMNVPEAILAGEEPDPEMNSIESLKAAFSLGNQVSPFLAHSRPLRWAAVHFSELARNRRGGDFLLAWQEILWPSIGAFGVFVREGVPVGILTDHQLEEDRLEGVKVLFLPNPDELTRVQKSRIRQFVAEGGILLKNRANWFWSDPDQSDSAAGAFRNEVKKLIQCLNPPVQVLSSQERLHAVTFEDKEGKRLLVAVTNDFSWVQWVPRDGLTNEPNPPPAPVNDAVVVIKHRPAPLEIIEVVGNTQLTRQTIFQGYKIQLAPFQTMALLVIQE